MNKYFSLASLGVMVACFGSAFGMETLPYDKALEKAVVNKKAVVVLCDGSDWLPQSESIRKAYQELADNAGDMDAVVIWAIQDEKNVQTEEEKKAKRPPLKVWNYPAFQVVDSEGRPLYVAEGVTPDVLVKKAPAMIKKVLEAAEKRDKIWEDAKSKQGPDAAGLIGKGLDQLPEKAAREYKAQLEEIKKADPEDKRGYYLKYTYNFLPFKEGDLNKLIEEKKYADAYKLIEKKLNASTLTTYQKQSIMTGKFIVARAEGDLTKALNYLRQVAAVSPDTEYAKAALALVDIYTKPVMLQEMKWRTSDNRPVWLPMVVDVSSAVKGSGTYEIEFKGKGGHTRFRKASFRNSSGKVLVEAPDDKESAKFTLNLPSGPSKVLLQVESQGTGWFDGRGDIVVTKK